MKIFCHSDLKLSVLFLACIIFVTYLFPAGMLFAQGEEEEKMLEELTSDGETTEEGSIEVLGFTEKDSSILNDRFLITIIALIAAAIGGLFLSFVIRART